MPNKKTVAKASKPKAAVKPQTKTKQNSPQPTHDPALIPGVLNLAVGAWTILWRNRKTVSLIILCYGIGYLVLVLGLNSPGNVVSLKKDFSSFFHGHLSAFFSSLSIFTYLIGSNGNSSPAGSAYEGVLVVVASLSIIWALRQFYNGTKIRARDSYYQGLYPLVQFTLVLLFMALELLPMALGLVLYSILVQGGIAVNVFEKVLADLIVIGLSAVSLYLIASSVIALYIVTLQGMTPMKAIRSAKNLVKQRRWLVLRKLIFLPILLFVVTGIVMLPVILVLPGLAAWIFLVLSLIALTYIHSYLYNLYRGLINDKSPS